MIIEDKVGIKNARGLKEEQTLHRQNNRDCILRARVENGAAVMPLAMLAMLLRPLSSYSFVGSDPKVGGDLFTNR